MSNPTGIVEMDWDTWCQNSPEEANATDASFCEDYGAEMMDAIVDEDAEALRKLSFRIEKHREHSIGSTGEARRQEAIKERSRKWEALRLRLEKFDTTLAALRSDDPGRRAEAIGELVGILQPLRQP